jgi:hypothetical protein
MRFQRSWPRPATLAVGMLMSVGLLMAGCGGDDGPTDPGTVTEFDQELALQQAAISAPMAIEMVENMPLFADGVAGKDFSYSFAWDQETMSWRAEYAYDEAGYSFEFVYHVQFLDGQGNPQPSEVGAVAMNYSEDGVGDFVYEDERSSLYAHQEFSNEMAVAGLDTDTYTIQGSGGYDFRYEAHSDGNSATLDLTVTWETLADGISYPVEGCPTGAIRYHFAPYYVDVTFDGSDTAIYVLYDAAGNPVPGGSGTEMLSCGI